MESQDSFVMGSETVSHLTGDEMAGGVERKRGKDKPREISMLCGCRV